MLNRNLKIFIFALKNLPKFTRLCVQLLEEWYKLETFQIDNVGVL